MYSDLTRLGKYWFRLYVIKFIYMLKKIFSAASYLALSIFIASTAIFSGINPVVAAQMGSDMDEENSMGIVIEKSSNALDGSKTSAAPDLGDDQAFPFIPGFGKNSGKDWSNFYLKRIDWKKITKFCES